MQCEFIREFVVPKFHIAVAISAPSLNLLVKLNKRNIRKRCEVCSKLAIKTPERRYDLEIEETEIFNLVNVQLNRRKNNTAKIYLFKVSRRNSRKRCDICSKLTINTPERRHLVIQDEILGDYNIIPPTVMLYQIFKRFLIDFRHSIFLVEVFNDGLGWLWHNREHQRFLSV